MSFAGAYLQKAALRPALIREEVDSGLNLIVTIPVHRESGLERCLDSLFVSVSNTANQGSNPAGIEVLLMTNARVDAPAEVLEMNLTARDAAIRWAEDHSHPQMKVHILPDQSFPGRFAGVGIARKILMDEAVRRFDVLDRPGGIIASLDADTVVDPGYFQALLDHFSQKEVEGCSIYFEHPLRASEDPFGETGEYGDKVYNAAAAYELHLRYYLQSVRSTGYPHAFHTVGSAFAVRAKAYCSEGGMNRRQGGEDFYFIQKLAQRGHWSDCTSTRVVPSPRPSDRVPFGTGPAVQEICSGSWPLLTYHPVPFRILRHWLSHMDEFLPGKWASPYPVLNEFLESQDFNTALSEIRANTASTAAYRKRFWRWFNMFRIMKFVHHAREEEYPDAEVRTVASLVSGLRSVELYDLLEHFREKDLAGDFNFAM